MRMCRHISALIATVVGLLALGHCLHPAIGEPAAETYKSTPGPANVQTMLCDWTDTPRNRQVPVKIYYPDTGTALPVIIFSHGLGGTREAYEYLGRHWASWGYVSVHLQHPGSDDSVWRGLAPADVMAAMKRAAANPMNAINRSRDVKFALDQLTRMNGEEGPLKGRLDLARVGMSGHSFGGWTTMSCIGQTLPALAGKTSPMADPRIRAAIAMSAPAPKLNPEKAVANIKVPLMHMTGTLDDSPIGETKASERRIAFDALNGPEQYLVTFIGGDHMVFSGRVRGGGALTGMTGDGAKDEVFHSLILQGTTAFWDWYLRGDEKAGEWLRHGGYAAALDGNATLETKGVK
jgi:predicted dienelactone hydrolase